MNTPFIGPVARDRLFLGAVVGLTLVAALQRGWVVAEWPLWYDEAATWLASRADPVEFARWEHHPDHPPLSFMLVSLTVAVLGTDAEWALRLPSVIAGLLAIPAAYAVGVAVRSRPTGLGFAALVTFSPLFIEQGRHARMYSLLALVVLLVLLWLVDLERRERPEAWRWGLLGVGLAAAVWTHALGLVFVAAVAIGLLDRGWIAPHRAGRPTDRALLGGAGLAVALAAALSHVGIVAWTTKLLAWEEAPEVSTGTVGTAVTAAAERVTPNLSVTVLGLAAVGAAAVGLVLLARRSRILAVVLGAMALLSIFPATAAALERPHGVGRFLILFRLSLMAGLAALAGLADGPGLRTVARSGLALVVLGLAILAVRTPRPDHFDVGDLVRSLAGTTGGSAVVYHPDWVHRLGFYYGLPPVPAGSTEDGWRPADPFPYPATWLVVGHTDPGDRSLYELIDALSARYDVAPPARTAVDRFLARHRSVGARFDSTGVSLRSPVAPGGAHDGARFRR